MHSLYFHITLIYTPISYLCLQADVTWKPKFWNQSIRAGVLSLLADAFGASRHIPSATSDFNCSAGRRLFVISFVCPQGLTSRPCLCISVFLVRVFSESWNLQASITGKFWGIEAAFHHWVTEVSAPEPQSPTLWMGDSRRHSEHFSEILVELQTFGYGSHQTNPSLYWLFLFCSLSLLRHSCFLGSPPKQTSCSEILILVSASEKPKPGYLLLATTNLISLCLNFLLCTKKDLFHKAVGRSTGGDT